MDEKRLTMENFCLVRSADAATTSPENGLLRRVGAYNDKLLLVGFSRLFKHRPCLCLLTVNVFRQPHNPKVGGSNPPPQPTFFDHLHPTANSRGNGLFLFPFLDFQCFPSCGLV